MINLLVLLISLYEVAVVIRAILSWVRPVPDNAFVRYIHQITDPLLIPLQRSIPPLAGSIDLSPFIVILLAEILKRFFISL